MAKYIGDNIPTVIVKASGLGGVATFTYTDSRYPTLLGKQVAPDRSTDNFLIEQSGTGTNNSRYLTDGNGLFFQANPGSGKVLAIPTVPRAISSEYVSPSTQSTLTQGLKQSTPGALLLLGGAGLLAWFLTRKKR